MTDKLAILREDAKAFKAVGGPILMPTDPRTTLALIKIIDCYRGALELVFEEGHPDQSVYVACSGALARAQKIIEEIK